MELIALKTFEKVAKEGGILAAAKQLNTVQSNVTTRIQRLEEELGTKLFSRKGRGLELTRPGMILLEYAEQILQLERQAGVAVRLADKGAAEIKIGAMETFTATHLPQLLGALRESCPKLKPQVTAATTAELLRAVLEHHIDCAFVAGPIDHPDLVTIDVMTQELVLVKPGSVAPADNLVLFREGCVYRQKALQWSRNHQNNGYGLSELGTLEGILGCVAQGLGVTLMPRNVVELSIYRDNLEFEPLPDDVSLVPTQFIRHRSTPALNVIEALFDSLRWLPNRDKAI
ncbi:DNA-binding transcriptional regulator, LysR family [Amphritea atlantica]|uniref:DNA-binding transcriptional regulator, LysR family n=1 Tax=Amphritea atlantica TaxID=355243 RepID=A0A1H9D176_9GAMM|nr:LysR family transcriptional regulator [Amphritea atlantica]SEQ07139.1 DNA-binding transcriptional regulator, LysR family [Amphritea atlantica]